jgi:hypothetical protein
MAAGLGFKDFTTGEVLTAADVDGYLMQGIWVFASTAARDASVTSPSEGNFAFTKDTNSLWYYDGATWVASGATGDIEGVTAGIGISGGGTSGTVTVTNSMATAIDAKGDLVAGTGADTFAKLTVGANDTVLTADSTAATGLKWAAAAGGSSFVGAKATSSSSTSATNGTWVAIAFQTEDFDTNTFHDNSTNNTRITIPSGKAGKYLFIGAGGLTGAGGGTGRRFLTLYKNGSQIAATQLEFTASSLAVMQLQTTAILDLAVSDYIELYILQTSGSAINTDFGLSTLSCQFVGA